MAINAALLDHLLTRRSVGGAFLAEPGPTPDELEQLLTAATRVPDHGKLAPWRLIVFAGDARVQAAKSSRPSRRGSIRNTTRHRSTMSASAFCRRH